MEASAALPLRHLRVVEWGTHVCVPSAARILATYGADVIKLEPFEGERWRKTGTEYGTPADDEENPYFTQQNSNKRFISINLKTEAGIAAFHKLLAETDVFITNKRNRFLKKIGLDYESVKDRYPQLIYCLFTGYGLNGPDAELPGFDTAAFWGRTGPLADWVEKGAFPFKPSPAFGDTATGLLMFGGVMMALYARTVTERGTFLTSSLLGNGIWCSQPGIVSSQECYGFQYPEPRMGPPNALVHYYLCKDGEWIAMSAWSSEKAWPVHCKAFGWDDWVHLRPKKDIPVSVMVEDLNKQFLTKTADEWVKYLAGFDIAAARCWHHSEVTKDEQAWANDYLTEMTWKNGHKSVMTKVPLHFSEYQQAEIRQPDPVGAQTREVLRELGYTDQDIDKMCKDQIIHEAETIKA